MQRSYARQARDWLEFLCKMLDDTGRIARVKADWWTVAAPVAVGIVASQASCQAGVQPPRTPSTRPEICSDGVDNDQDGAIDCADSDCVDSCAVVALYAAPPVEPIQNTERECGNGRDDDGDGLVDGADPDCMGHAVPAYAVQPNPRTPASSPQIRRETQCHDGRDNDGDGMIDCADPDCVAICSGAEYMAPTP